MNIFKYIIAITILVNVSNCIMAMEPGAVVAPHLPLYMAEASVYITNKTANKYEIYGTGKKLATIVPRAAKKELIYQTIYGNNMLDILPRVKFI